MKHTQLLIIALFFMGLVIPCSVHAQEQVKYADNTAQLKTHMLEPNPNSKDDRVLKLSSVLSRYNSPLQQEADTFIKYADEYGLDWKLVAAIAGVESGFGRAIPAYSYNAWGWGIPTGASSGIGFSSWEEGIQTVSYGLKTRYVDRGAVTVEQIGRIYAASSAWPVNVRHFMAVIHNAPTLTPAAIEVTI